MKKVIKSTNQIKILFLWVDSDGPPYSCLDHIGKVSQKMVGVIHEADYAYSVRSTW